jgi:hypothetical protein
MIQHNCFQVGRELSFAKGQDIIVGNSKKLQEWFHHLIDIFYDGFRTGQMVLATALPAADKSTRPPRETGELFAIKLKLSNGRY